MDFKAKLALQIGMGGPGPPKKKSTRVVKTFGSAAGESSTDHPVTGNRNAAATAALMGGWGATQQNRSRGPESSSTSVAPRLLVSAEARDRIRLGRESMSTRKRRPPTRSRVVRRPVGGGGATAAALTAGGGATAAAASQKKKTQSTPKPKDSATPANTGNTGNTRNTPSLPPSATFPTPTAKKTVAVPKENDAERAARHSLGLGASDVQAYGELWRKAWGDPVPAAGSAGSTQTQLLLLPASKAAGFFQSSGLGNKALQAIWRLSDTLPPKGKLSQAEFNTALKLISLAQAGKAAAAANLSERNIPLPSLGTWTAICRKRPIVLAVIVGLPGLGKSYFLKQFSLMLDQRGPEHAGQFLMLHKDQLTAEFKKMNERSSKATMAQIQKMILARVQATPDAKMVVYNMNMNIDWFKSLASLFVQNDFTLSKVVVLTPPRMLSHRQLQAVAVVLAGNRTGDEPDDMRSTLPATKAWEVLMGSFFGDPRKATTYKKLSRAMTAVKGAAGTAVVAVEYPVPQLNSSVRIPKTPPPKKPAEWAKESMHFPTEAQFTAAFKNIKHWLAATNGTDGSAKHLVAKKAAAFFMTSNITTKALQAIWRLSDTLPPKGKLSQAEFNTALKLISLAQAGKAAAAANLGMKGVPPPTFNMKKEGVVLKLSESHATVYRQLWSETGASSAAGAGAGGGAAGASSAAAAAAAAAVGSAEDWLSAGKAATFFQSSGLPLHVLRTIWTLSDTLPPKGKLSQAEFNSALKLIAAAQAGMKVDVAALRSDAPLPRVGSRAAAMTSSASSPSAASRASSSTVAASTPLSLGLGASDVQAYGELWRKAWGDPVPAAGSAGSTQTQLLLLPASKAAGFFQSSGLGNKALQAIWRLSDTLPPKGKLSQAEFNTALKLISLAQAGKAAAAANLSERNIPLPSLGKSLPI
eukprot:gene9085-26819_t